MSLPNLSSDKTESNSELAGVSTHTDYSAADPGFRNNSDFVIGSGLDGFVSEDNDSATGSGVARVARQREGDAAREPRIGRAGRESSPAAGAASNVVSMATRALSQARASVSGFSARGKIATFVPKLFQTAHLSRFVADESLVGQTSAPVPQSISTLTRPRWQFDTRLVIPLVLAIFAFGELWWVSHRLSNPAQSLAESNVVPTPPVVAESSENVVSLDRKGGSELRMRVTFRSVTPSGADVDRKAPSWVAISAPMSVEIIERGQQIGTSWGGGMKLTPGPHDLRIVNRSMGIDVQKTVEIPGGGMASLNLDFPPGSLQISATPWANVDVDGVAVGKTPLDKIELAPGRHDVLFTHPKYGQRRMSVTVKMGKPMRVSADMRRKGR
jgi:hypothetical protein